MFSGQLFASVYGMVKNFAGFPPSGGHFPAKCRLPSASAGKFAGMIGCPARDWMQSERTKTLSSGEFDRKNDAVCASFAQNESQETEAKCVLPY